MNKPCPQKINFCTRQRNDLRLEFIVHDENGDPVDLTDAQEITWQLSRNVGSPVLIEKTLTGASILINTPNSFMLDILDTEIDFSGSHYHEAQIITDLGLEYTAVQGRVRIDRTQI